MIKQTILAVCGAAMLMLPIGDQASAYIAPVLPEEIPAQEEVRQQLYTHEDVVMLARLVYGESRGIWSQTEQACVIWTVLNRLDAGWYDSIAQTVTAKDQFAYSPSAPTVDDYGRDLTELATDVLERWCAEHDGDTDAGRVLPETYFWYGGDGKHNYFRDEYHGGRTWDYSLPTPYES